MPTRCRLRQPLPYFNPRSPCGERRVSNAVFKDGVQFQSALPLRGATVESGCDYAAVNIFQSALPLRGATVVCRTTYTPVEFQSALPLRGATGKRCPPGSRSPISIRAPLAGSDGVYGYSLCDDCIFQSALPLRGATVYGRMPSRMEGHFNPRSPCGERPTGNFVGVSGNLISIRAPLAGSDGSGQAALHLKVISIRAPLAGSDPARSPVSTSTILFQSALPLRGATFLLAQLALALQISIRAPLAGSDRYIL